MLFFFATVAYIAVSTDAGAFIVIEVLTLSNGIPSSNISMSFNDDILQPHLPTSPAHLSLSASYPYRVGMSNAILRPV